MNKNDKKKELISLRKRQIENKSRHYINMYYKFLGIMGAMAFFLYKIYPSLANSLIIAGLFIFYYATYLHRLDGKYIDDLYDALAKAIIENKIEKYRVYTRTFFEKLIYYD